MSGAGGRIRAQSARRNKKIVSLYTNRMYRGVQRISAVRRMTRKLSPRGIIPFFFFFHRFNPGKTAAAFLGSARSRVIYRPARRDNLHSRHPRTRFRSWPVVRAAQPVVVFISNWRRYFSKGSALRRRMNSWKKIKKTRPKIERNV